MKNKNPIRRHADSSIFGILLMPLVIPIAIVAYISTFTPWDGRHEYLLKHGTARQKAKVRAQRAESTRIFRIWEEDERFRADHYGGKGGAI